MNSALRNRQARRQARIDVIVALVLAALWLVSWSYALDHPANKHPSREAWEAQQRQEAAR